MSEFWCEFEARTNWLDIYSLQDDGTREVSRENNEEENSIISPRGSKETIFSDSCPSDCGP